MKLTKLIARAPWREAVTYRDTWPHEYVLSEKDGQRDLLNAIYARFQDGEGVACRFFRVSNKYLFIGDFKYWFNSQWDGFDPSGENVINRARLYLDRRDFVIQPGDTGKPQDYPTNPARLTGLELKPLEDWLQPVINTGARAGVSIRSWTTALGPQHVAGYQPRDRLHERQPRTQRSVGGPLPCQGNGAGLAPLRPGTSTAAPVSLSPSGRPGKLRLEVGLAAAGRLRQPGWLGCGVRRQPAACQESVAACSSWLGPVVG